MAGLYWHSLLAFNSSRSYSAWLWLDWERTRKTTLNIFLPFPFLSLFIFLFLLILCFSPWLPFSLVYFSFVSALYHFDFSKTYSHSMHTFTRYTYKILNTSRWLKRGKKLSLAKCAALLNLVRIFLQLVCMLQSFVPCLSWQNKSYLYTPFPPFLFSFPPHSLHSLVGLTSIVFCNCCLVSLTCFPLHTSLNRQWCCTCMPTRLFLLTISRIHFLASNYFDVFFCPSKPSPQQKNTALKYIFGTRLEWTEMNTKQTLLLDWKWTPEFSHRRCSCLLMLGLPVTTDLQMLRTASSFMSPCEWAENEKHNRCQQFQLDVWPASTWCKQK